jgi:hypothetical protein
MGLKDPVFMAKLPEIPGKSRENEGSFSLAENPCVAGSTPALTTRT